MVTMPLMGQRSLVFLMIAAMVGCATPQSPFRSATTLIDADAGLIQPIGVVMYPDRGLLVTDSGNHRLVRVDTRRRVLQTWGEPGTAPSPFRRPLGIAVGPRSRVYVADYLNDSVQVLHGDGRPIARWTTFGNSDRFAGPVDVTLDSEGHVYVVEFNGSRVVKLDRGGQLIKTWGNQGHRPDQFYYPTGITVGPDRRIWITDAYNHRLKVYTADGELIQVIGGKGDRPGEFNVPGGVTFDHAGGVWVADFFNDRIQHFTDAPDGTHNVAIWTGESSSVGPLRRPTDLAMSPDRRSLYIVDYGNNRLVTLDVSQKENSTWDTSPVRSSLGRYWY